MYYLNQNVKELHRIFDQNERKGYLRLDLNENPGGLPDEFVRSILAEITPEMVAQYPETLHFTEVLAEYLDTDIQHLCLVNGSSEGIRYVIQAFTSEKGRIVGVVPSYFMFQVYSEMYGRTFVQVPYNSDLSMNVDKILSEMTEDTQLLILMNPNNPVGNTYTAEEFERIISTAESRKINVLVDEAYHYFYPESFMDYALKREHVFVTRTFSKLFSMAGCRLGYVAGWPEGIRMVQKLCTPHNTNVFALTIAEAILKNPKMVDQLIRDYKDGRSYLTDWLDQHGYSYHGDAGNFLFIKPKTDSGSIVDRMKSEKKILIKTYSGIGHLGNCLRVTIGGIGFMQRFTRALEELDR